MFEDKKMSKEQLEFIQRYMNSPNVNLAPRITKTDQQRLVDEDLEFEGKEQAQGRLSDLMKTFDIKHIETMFEEGIKSGVFGSSQFNLMLKMDFNGHTYILNRYPIGWRPEVRR